MRHRTPQDQAIIDAFAERLHDLRARRGRATSMSTRSANAAYMPQAALAERAGLDRSYWARLEKGDCDPSLTSLVRIQAALGLDSIETLLGATPSDQLTRIRNGNRD